MATSLASIHGASQILHTSPKLPASATTIRSQPSKEPQPQHLQTSRRATIGLALATLIAQEAPATVLAEEENNGFWLTGPLPVPTVTNDIANKETGTRSFLKKGQYMANIGVHGSKYRLRMYAFDLLALGDMLSLDAWNHFRRYLRLKSTTMYYDFDKVITASADEQKQPLVDLANRLFDNVEKMEDAAKKKNGAMVRSCYADTEPILREVMTQMAQIL